MSQIECIYQDKISSSDEHTHYPVFEKFPTWKYIIIILILALYSIPLFIIWKKRKTQELTPRSPYMTMLSLIYLMFDSVGNTILFSIKRDKIACFIGIIITVTC